MTIILGFVSFDGHGLWGTCSLAGTMALLPRALPFEGMMIGGAALGSFIAANSFANIAGQGGHWFKAFKGPKWNSGDYVDRSTSCITLGA